MYFIITLSKDLAECAFKYDGIEYVDVLTILSAARYILWLANDTCTPTIPSKDTVYNGETERSHKWSKWRGSWVDTSNTMIFGIS